MFRGHLGYEYCPTGELEPTVEKIAIYATESDFGHVAHQREDGTWSSKVGELGDICHLRLESLSGRGLCEYPPVRFYMRRMRQPHPLAETGLILP